MGGDCQPLGRTACLGAGLYTSQGPGLWGTQSEDCAWVRPSGSPKSLSEMSKLLTSHPTFDVF